MTRTAETSHVGTIPRTVVDRFFDGAPAVQHRQELLRDFDHPDLLARYVKENELVRIAHGYYAKSTRWQELSKERRHRELAKAVSRQLPHMQFSHSTAAILMGLPWLDPIPTRLHVVVGSQSNNRSTASIMRHRIDLDPRPVRVDGVRTTSPTRTVFDIACNSSFANGLACADAALKRRILSVSTLQKLVTEESTRAGIAKARLVARLVDARAESPGESFCRALIYELGFVMPELQYKFWDGDVSRDRGDFCWPKQRVWLEFDGVQKYKAAEFRNGRKVEDVVFDEKVREDRIRALGFTPIRLIWSQLYDPHFVAKELTRRGIPRRRLTADRSLT